MSIELLSIYLCPYLTVLNSGDRIHVRPDFIVIRYPFPRDELVPATKVLHSSALVVSFARLFRGELDVAPDVYAEQSSCWPHCVDLVAAVCCLRCGVAQWNGIKRMM
jgi:hypothetical protein